MMHELSATTDGAGLGGKARGLVRLLAAGARVPRAFALAADAHGSMTDEVRRSLHDAWRALGDVTERFFVDVMGRPRLPASNAALQPALDKCLREAPRETSPPTKW